MTTAALPPIAVAHTNLKKADIPTMTVDESAKLAIRPIPRFQLVKVKKPDGTVVTVKRQIVEVPGTTSTNGTAQNPVPKAVSIEKSVGTPTSSKSTSQPSPTSAVAKIPASDAPETALSAQPSNVATSALNTALKAAPQAAPIAEIIPSAPASVLPASIPPITTSTQSKSTPTPPATSAPKKKWYSGISKGVSNLNVDKIALALDSIEQATTRIDAALTGKPIPPKKASASTTILAASTSKPAALASPAPPTATILVKTSTPPVVIKPPSQTTAAAQNPTVVMLSTSSTPSKPSSTTPSAASIQSAPAVIVKTVAANTPVQNGTKPPPTTAQAQPKTIPAPIHSAAVPSSTAKALVAAPKLQPPPRTAPVPAHTVVTDTLLASNGAASILETSAAAHTTLKPAQGHPSATRSLADAPAPSQQGQYQDQKASSYAPAQVQYQNDATSDNSGADYSGLAEGALGGTALGVGGDVTYDEYEEYQSGDEVVEGGSEAEDELTTGPDVDDEVYEDYNPEEDEVVADDVSVTGSQMVAPADQLNGGNDIDGGVEEYDPEIDEIVEDGASDTAEAVQSEAEPAVEYAQSDPGQLEEPEHGGADVDVTPEPSDDGQNDIDTDDY